jgi:hypothetical protein
VKKKKLVKGHWVKSEEVDTVANLERQIEGEISKYQILSAFPFYDNAPIFKDPLLWWKQKNDFSSQSF